jgi:hypothetical protein
VSGEPRRGSSAASPTPAWQQSRLADAHGDRVLEPTGTRVSSLAVSRNSQSFGDRLYWTVDDTTFKSMPL